MLGALRLPGVWCSHAVRRVRLPGRARSHRIGRDTSLVLVTLNLNSSVARVRLFHRRARRGTPHAGGFPRGASHPRAAARRRDPNQKKRLRRDARPAQAERGRHAPLSTAAQPARPAEGAGHTPGTRQHWHRPSRHGSTVQPRRVRAGHRATAPPHNQDRCHFGATSRRQCRHAARTQGSTSECCSCTRRMHASSGAHSALRRACSTARAAATAAAVAAVTTTPAAKRPASEAWESRSSSDDARSCGQ